MKVKVSNKGWVVIPAEMRRKYKLHPGAKVHIRDHDGVLILIPERAGSEQDVAGLRRGKKSPTGATVAERRAERRRGKRWPG